MRHNLLDLLDITNSIIEPRNCNYLSINLRATPIAETIILFRRNKTNWLWNSSDITREENGFSLPSVDLADYLDVSSNNDLEKYFRVNNITTSGIEFDTESSTCYPRFSNNKDALTFINEFDKHLDSIYLPELEVIVNN